MVASSKEKFESNVKKGFKNIREEISEIKEAVFSLKEVLEKVNSPQKPNKEYLLNLIKDKKIVAIIPARGGSKGIPKKNIKNLAGKPLIVHTIEQAKESKYIEDVYVSTDDEEIADISSKFGAKIIKRPSEFATDTASSEVVLFHFAKEIDFDIMVFFQCTSPLRYSYQIDEAIEKLIEENANSLLTGYTNDRFLWDKRGNSINYDFKNRPRRQDKEWEFVENGSFYVTSKEELLKNKNRLGGKIAQYVMPKWMSFEIDEPFDFELIEILMKEKLEKGVDKKY